MTVFLSELEWHDTNVPDPAMFLLLPFPDELIAEDPFPFMEVPSS